jgi:replicative DNA helicase
MTRKEATLYIRSQSPEAFLPRAKAKGYVCPKCQNGTGKDGDGIVLYPKTGAYTCFKCGFSGDIFDLIGIKFGLSEFNDQFKKAVEIYGITVEKYSSRENRSLSSEQKAQAAKTISEVAVLTQTEDIRKYLSVCHAAAGQTGYFAKRGITQESIDRFFLGYDPAYDEKNVGCKPWQAVIIPTSSETFEARNTQVSPDSSDDGKNKYRKHGSCRIFNVSSLQEEKEQPIFVCEGVFDAISIIQSGGQAVGLGSAVNYKYLIAELDKVTPAKPMILAFDADETGRSCAKRMEAELQARNIPYFMASDLYGDYHDANDMLLKAPEKLKEAIARTSSLAASSVPGPDDEAKNEYLETSAGKSLQAFMEAIQASAGRPRMSTGFQPVDDALEGGIYTGLYVIGAISSLGKTTLTLQIADNLAKQGRDVLFFSLEQSKFDLMSKSISRETCLYCRRHNIDVSNAKSNLGILDGRRWKDFNKTEKKVVNESFRAYSSYAKHIFIFEGIGNISVAEIRDHIKAHISVTGNARPVIFIDYLQILKAAKGDERASDKQIVDHNITALKQLSRDFDIPIIAVSSLNRQNYAEQINMAAFKESGAIEYGSDVLIGLQLTGAGEKGFDVNKAKEKDPRKIDFCILKNRNGKTLANGLPMTFYPVFNCFMAGDGPDDGIVPLNMTDEDNCL